MLFRSVKKAERRRIDAFELWCWRRLLRVPWTSRRSNQSILKEISPLYSLEGLMLKLMLKPLTMWITENWKIPQEMGITDHLTSVQFTSVAQSCPTLRPHGLQQSRLPCLSPTPRVGQTHVHDASSSHQVAKLLEFQLQHQYFQ